MAKLETTFGVRVVDIDRMREQLAELSNALVPVAMLVEDPYDIDDIDDAREAREGMERVRAALHALKELVG
jgi:hypothetical protein